MDGERKISRGRLFIENFIIYGVGGTLNRIVPFIMLPIITRLYPSTAYLGLNNNVNTMISFASQIAILGIYDALFRYYFEKEEAGYRRTIASSALIIVTLSGTIMTAILIMLRKPISQLVFSDVQYENLVVIGAITMSASVIKTIMMAPTRLRNQRSRYLAVNLLSSIASYGIAIPLVLKGEYTVAMPLAGMVAALLVLIVFTIFNYKEFSFFSGNRECIGQLLKFGIPCMPSFVFYWLMSSVQTILITNIIGLEAAGIFSVGAKIATVSQLIYMAFAAGWQYFAFSTMKDKDQVQLTTKVFDYLGGISFFAVCIMVLIAHPLFLLLFEPEYAEGAWVVPALFLTPLIQMLFQTIGNQFLVVKKPAIGTLCLLFGAAAALGTSFALIPIIGIRGPALGGLAGYTLTTCITVGILLKMKLIELPGRVCLGALVAMGSVLIFTFQANAYMYIAVAVIGSIVIAAMYRKDLLKTIQSLMGGLKTKS